MWGFFSRFHCYMAGSFRNILMDFHTPVLIIQKVKFDRRLLTATRGEVAWRAIYQTNEAQFIKTINYE